MKKIKYLVMSFLSLLLFLGCTSYEPKVYGPVDFEISFEGPFFKDGVTDGIATVKFEPEKFGISREEIVSLKVNEITVSTESKEGLGIFENLVFSIMTNNTETKEVASSKIKTKSKNISLKGLQEVEIKGFRDTKEFFLEATGITNQDFEGDFKLKGTIKMELKVPEK